ncbi:hypothetical protein [Klebsiella aerogenes]|uniref:hypothetical protein n=1 Tax=Klebsiella aerogenes TaxID=548 RepID=UPI00254F5755|nr:hypothetical protein [Klebsiella aerogenes]MDK7097231.1 hypothetical protein [Klebsiella aerogenes]MDK7642665.1 hypothetical protein [Klebsiella aerogenes]MDK7847072.1 hypothetical protein [Klebsiella aerogenes]MDK8312851.1 hypothetical protein [Klebsiella aerogenes]
MIDVQQEQTLQKHGFTSKEINMLRKELESPQRKAQSLQVLLVELRRRFYMSCIIIIALLIFCSYAVLTNDTGNGLAYFAVTAVCCAFALIATPYPLSWKAIIFLRKKLYPN